MSDATDDFPITWEDPAHADVAWEYDRVHSPHAALPLAFDLASKPFVAGFGWMPHDPIQMNYYIYYPYVALAEKG